MFIWIYAFFAGGIIWVALVIMEQYKKRTNSAKQKLLIDYSVYELSTSEKIGALFVAAVILFAIGFIFYKNLANAALLSLLCFRFLGVRRKQLLAKRKSELNDQFKQALFSLSSSLSAGRSVENSFYETVQDLQMLYANPRTYIIIEFNVIVQKLRNGDNIENALNQFSDRANVEDIRNFAEVFTICKRSGGNLIEVIRRTAAMIGEKIEIQQDIALLISQKKFESRILSIAPVVIVALLSFSSPDYMLPLYHGANGWIIMSCSLAVLFGCYAFTNKIMDIRV